MISDADLDDMLICYETVGPLRYSHDFNRSYYYDDYYAKSYYVRSISSIPSIPCSISKCDDILDSIFIPLPYNYLNKMFNFPDDIVEHTPKLKAQQKPKAYYPKCKSNSILNTKRKYKPFVYRNN